MSPTPILDRQEPVPSAAQPRRMVYYLVGAVIGGGIAFAPAGIQGALANSPVSILPIVAALCGGVLLHEIGHLIAGLALGFEFRSILSGPLMLTKEAGGYRFRFLPSRILGGGYTAMLPKDSEDLRHRFLLFVAGGPIATALLFLPVILLPWGTWTASLLVANGILALSSWIPSVTKGQPSDAKIMLLLSRQGPSSDRLVAILYLIGVDGRGVRPRDWPRDLIDKLTVETTDRAYYSAGRLYYYLYLKDGGAPDEMAAALEKLLATTGELRGDFRRAYFAEAAFFQSAVKGNVALATAWLADARKVKHAIKQPDWDASAMFGIALAEGKQAEAQGHLTRALAFLDRRAGTSGSIAAARERLLVLGERQVGAS